MRICVTNIMSFSSTFRQKTKIKDLCDELGINRERMEAYFALYLSNLIKARIKRSILIQKVNGKPMRLIYEPLSKEYQKRKTPENRNKFYLNTGWMYENIKVYRYGGKYYIGFPKWQRHKYSKAKASDILSWNELGTSKAPARPIVEPHLRFVMKHLSEYWDNFEKLMTK